MGDGLTVSTSELAQVGAQVASSSDPILSASAALADVQAAVTVPAVGTGIAAAATGFCGDLASRATALTGSTQSQGDAITHTARLYTSVDQQAAGGFERIYTASPAI